jgi:hypothetical protein
LGYITIVEEAGDGIGVEMSGAAAMDDVEVVFLKVGYPV